MCEYRFRHFSAPASQGSCSIGSYFDYWNKLKFPPVSTPTEWSSEIPVDANGLCLFHSRDVEWKTQNHFHSRFLQLLKILEGLSMDAKRPTSFTPIDLRECYFIGIPRIGSKDRSIILENLDLFGPVQLDFQNSIFEDAMSFRKMHLKQTQVNFSHCQFKGLCQFYESKLGHLNLSHTSLTGGLLINHSSFYDTFCADHLRANGIFELSSNAFFQGASFQNLLLHTYFAHVEANLFYSTVNFNDSTIKSDNYFLSNYFHRDILFLNVDFQRSFSFSENTVEGMIRLKSHAECLLKPSTKMAAHAYRTSSGFSPEQITSSSQLKVISQKINAISKRIRETNPIPAVSEQNQTNPPKSQHLSDAEELIPSGEAGITDNSNSMQGQREEYHAFLSFAEEDAETAKNLYKALTRLGLNIWFSKVHLSTGDSIINTINQAIHNSRSGIVLISLNTFNDRRHFPILELNSLLTRDLYHNKPFFPVYHEITPEEVSEQLILIGDRLATLTTKGIDVAARQLFEALQKQQVL